MKSKPLFKKPISISDGLIDTSKYIEWKLCDDNHRRRDRLLLSNDTDTDSDSDSDTNSNFSTIYTIYDMNGINTSEARSNLLE